MVDERLATKSIASIHSLKLQTQRRISDPKRIGERATVTEFTHPLCLAAAINDIISARRQAAIRIDATNRKDS